MEKLQYTKETHKLLKELAGEETCYWRYQDSSYKGLIPTAHKSHERMFTGEEPEHIEEGVSCYDNPWQLLEYMSNEALNVDKVDVVLFLGRYTGSGIDGEDIVKVEEESDVLYSLSLRDFYKFVFSIEEEIYWNGINIKEKFLDYDEEFIEGIFEK